MEQIYNAMLSTVKAPAERPASANKSGEKEGFQKLMDQKQSGSAAASQKETGETPAKAEEAAASQETEAPVVQDPKELEERMSLAAMAAMTQNPLVADIAEETPQVLTDPNWEDGFVPVSYVDQGDYRIVSWARTETVTGQELEASDGEAAEWMAGQTAEEAEAVVKAPAEPEVEAPVVEVGPETAVVRNETAGEELPELQDAEVETPVFGEVEAAPMKVGEAPAGEEKAQAREIGEQIAPWAVKIASVTGSDGSRTITVHLEPEQLGKVHVEVSLEKDGSLRLVVNAENSHTQSLLSRNSESLAAILGKYAESSVHVEIPRQEENQRQDLLNQQQQQNRQQQQQERHHREDRQAGGEDFLHQMRLGLIGEEEI